MNNRDEILLKSIFDTIDEIGDYLDRFNATSFDSFISEDILKRAVTMCLISISEMVDALSNDFKKTYSQINFKRFKTLRNIAAHKYGAVNFEIVWEIINKNLPVYKRDFEKILKHPQ